MAEQTNNSMEGNENASETAPLLIETEEQHTEPVPSTSLPTGMTFYGYLKLRQYG